MVCKTHKYGNGGQVKGYADGGEVKKNPLPPHVPPKIKDPIPPATNPGGPHTPGAKAKRKAKKMADGGPVYGAPMGTPPPGGTTRKRPKVGDKSSDTSRLNPKKRTPSKPPVKSGNGHEGSVYRDYRGTMGVVDDAVKGK